jgi:ubiquinone/menaquinone biosynthesis C-methylase UbiE
VDAGQKSVGDDDRAWSVAQRQFPRRPSAYQMAPLPSHDKFLGFMISASGVTRRDRVLDVACGTGSATLAFAPHSASVTGIDVVAEPLRRARVEAVKRKLGNARFTLSEVERLAFADGAFTGAICRFSFHHFVNPEQVFAEMARVVAPGGWMMIADMTAPDDPAQAALHNQMERLCDPTHGRALTVMEFEQLFAAHGFRVAMKIARDSRLTFDDWLRFGPTPPANAAHLRTMVAAALENGTPSRFSRDGDTIRVIHTSVSFVIESEA